ncbi:tRNA1(Val) (adenine(37)-N6)-methyltransferase [Pontibacter chinhatensis]|uniref:tRNA1(Val) (adenine(37)-N6)-methyltransferase n=1 Tax=Pontibacter chinhatensis TaxID=1436961 RepID=A0A1I2YKV3_9BACT|nr:methyltransferase [Pontibacter chinhatensis]SFH25676.1 tRNA1Val (adenine37-N6)-methyltransferase [Pontibacter chinhatensis]
MPNSYFQFKQFRVEQDRCAMKVCTDSCVFGAYVEVGKAQRILDIGTGTGLLALMVAQRSGASIDAVEINAEAQQQAQENFTASPWADRLHLHPMPLQAYAQQQLPKYDVILSNPPFFLSSLKSADAAKNTAKHTGELLFEDILYFAQQRLTQHGKLYLLLPPAEALYFAGLAKASVLYLAEVLQVYTYHGGKCIRHIQTYTYTPVTAPEVKDFFIREADKTTYTSEFRQLLQPYYLYL